MPWALPHRWRPRKLEAAEDEDEDGEGLPSLHKAALDREPTVIVEEQGSRLFQRLRAISFRSGIASVDPLFDVTTSPLSRTAMPLSINSVGVIFRLCGIKAPDPPRKGEEPPRTGRRHCQSGITGRRRVSTRPRCALFERFLARTGLCLGTPLRAVVPKPGCGDMRGNGEAPGACFLCEGL